MTEENTRDLGTLCTLGIIIIILAIGTGAIISSIWRDNNCERVLTECSKVGVNHGIDCPSKQNCCFQYILENGDGVCYRELFEVGHEICYKPKWICN